MKRNNIKWTELVRFLLIVAVVMFAFSVYSASSSINVQTSAFHMNSGDVLTLNVGETVVQEIVSDERKCELTQLAFAIDTPGVEVPGVLTVSLYANDVLWEQWTRDIGVIGDNEVQYFVLQEPLLMEDENAYSFAVSAVYSGEEKAGLLLTNEGQLGEVLVSSADAAGQAVNYQIGYLADTWMSNGVILGLVALCGTVALKWLVAKKQKKGLRMLRMNRSVEAVLAASLFLTVSRLMYTVFFPSLLVERNESVYLVSPFLILVLTGVIAIAYAFDVDGLVKSLAAVVGIWLAAWMVGHLVKDNVLLYRIVYYLALAAACYSVARCAMHFTVKNGVAWICKFFCKQKLFFIWIPVSVAIGAMAELIRAYCVESVFMLPQWFFWTTAALCAGWLFLLYRQKEGFSEKAFLLIALTAGIYMSCAVPATTLVSWDDEIHFANTVWLAQGSNYTCADYSMIIREVERTFSIPELEKVFAYFAVNSQKVAASSAAVGAELEIHQTIGYIPHCIGMWIGQVLNLPYLFTFIMGRIGSLVSYALLIYYGMKRMQSCKLLLAVLALLPTNLFQACSYTYDGWVFSVTAFGICWFIGVMQQGEAKLTRKDQWIMLLVLALGVMPKGVYFPLILLLQFIPKEKFEDMKRYKAHLLLVFAVAAVCFVVYLVLPLLGGSYLSDARGGAGVDSVQQVIFILRNPFAYAKILLNFLKGYLAPENSWQYTCYMAYLNGKDFHAVLFALICVAAVVDRRKVDRYYDNALVKIGSGFFLFVTVCAVASILYITFTPVAHPTVLGCQPRYLAPLLFPFFALVGNITQVREWKTERIAIWILGITAYVCFNCMWYNFVGLYTM